MTWDTLLRNGFAVVLGLLVAGIGVGTAAGAVHDLRLRRRGRPALATVVRVETEPLGAATGERDRLVVTFVDDEGVTHHDVRLRTGSALPVAPGRTVRVRYLPGDPRVADRPHGLSAAARLLVAPAVVGLAVVVAGVAVAGPPG